MRFNVKNLWKSAKNFAVKQRPEIFTGTGVAGIFIGGGLTVYATVKAFKAVEAKKKKEGVEHLTKKEVVKETWKYYIPPVTTFLASAGLIIWSDAIYRKRNAALTMACTVAETQFTNYQDKVLDTFGTENERKVYNESTAETAKTTNIEPNEYIISSSGVPCYDPFNGRCFRIEKFKIEDAIVHHNTQMNNGDDAKSLNDIFFSIGLPTTDLGDVVGWNRSRGPIELDLSQSIMVDGVPRMVLDFYNRPYVSFDD